MAHRYSEPVSPQSVELVCENCKEVFYMPQSQLKYEPAKYCSVECYRDPRRRLFEKVNKKGPFVKRLNSRCWEWTGATMTGKDYGRMRFNGGREGVHRISWILHYGEIPDGMQINHKCDNPPCVNPNHLKLGTPADNAADIIRRNRGSPNRGEDHPSAELTWDDVREIRRLYATGEYTYKDLADHWDVTHRHIGVIVRHEQWREE